MKFRGISKELQAHFRSEFRLNILNELDSLTELSALQAELNSAAFSSD
jgi:hypothetical protein